MSDKIVGAIDAVLRRWQPVTHDFGLVEASAEAAAAAFASGLRDGDIETVARRVTGSLNEALAALLPLSVQMQRALLLGTHSDWTAFFRGGIRGSDPSFTMCWLAGRLRKRTMRVCLQERPPWKACIWEVYEPSSAPDAIHGGRARRTLAALNDGGRWMFEEVGERFAFEQGERYALPRRRDRFDHTLLRAYLMQFGLRPFEDAFYRPGAGCGALVVEQVAAWPQAPQDSLDEVVAGLPWLRGSQ